VSPEKWGWLTLYRMVMPIGTPFLKEKNNN